MCVAAIAWDAHPDWLFVCAGNRDEYHARPAAPLARWPDDSGIIAGRDLTGGGTWMGVSEAGRFALVTNFRVPEGPQPGRPTRGHLVTELLTAGPTSDDLGNVLAMNPFNVIWIDRGSAGFIANHPRLDRRSLAAGIHGLSNGGFDVPWPKTVQVQHAIQDWMDAEPCSVASLLDALRSERDPAVGIASPDGPEPRLAPVFIRDQTYGTRCSTVVTVDRRGRGTIVERTFAPDGTVTGERAECFVWPT